MKQIFIVLKSSSIGGWKDGSVVNSRLLPRLTRGSMDRELPKGQNKLKAANSGLAIQKTGSGPGKRLAPQNPEHSHVNGGLS